MIKKIPLSKIKLEESYQLAKNHLFYLISALIVAGSIIDIFTLSYSYTEFFNGITVGIILIAVILYAVKFIKLKLAYIFVV